jgi:membrane dipeptidase
VNQLHREAIVIVGHSDIIASDVDWRRESGQRKVLVERHLPTLRKGGVTVICDHIGGDAPYGYLPATRYRTTHPQRFMRALDHTFAEIEESEELMLVLEADDIRQAKKDGKIGVVICLEGGAPLDGELSYLRNYHRLGLRCLGLTHDMRNELADGIRERNAGGLTHFGVSVVEECNRLGILVDVSHLSDKGTEDVLSTSSAPITASHSNARAICSHPRNLPDEFIREIAQRGGVIGFHALDGLVSEHPHPKLDDVLTQIAHLAEVGGVDCISIGPDLMENWDSSVFTNVYDRSTSIGGLPVQHYDWTYPEGMQSNADLPNITEGLLKMGFGEEDVRKFLGGNLLRLFELTWKTGHHL